MDKRHQGEKCGVTHFRNITQYAQSFRGVWEFDFQQLEASIGSGSCRFAVDGRAVIYEEIYPATIGLKGMIADGLIGFVLSDRTGRSGRWWGDEAPEAAVAYADPAKEIDVSLPGGTENVVAVLPLESFREQFEVLAGAPSDQQLPGKALFRHLDPGRRRRLEQTWRALVRRPVSADDLGTRIVESLVSAVGPSASDEPAAPTKAARVLYKRAMARAEDGELVVSPAELALELKVSQRSLEMAFRACMGVPPARYLRRLRLNRAHERLLWADPENGQVSEVALDLGFTELGRFAGEYRRLFGELPSETLRRSNRIRSRLLLAPS